MSISRLKYGLSRLNGPIYEDLTFASGKGINFDAYGLKLIDNVVHFGDDSSALMAKMFYGSNVAYGGASLLFYNEAGNALYHLAFGGATIMTGGAIATYNSDSATLLFNATDDDGAANAQLEVARMVGANDPYFAFGSNGNAAKFYNSGVSEFTGNVSFTAGKTLTGYNNVTENHTAGDTLTLAESGSIHTNYGAGGAVALKLPASATAGTTFKFVVGTAQELRITVSAAAEVFLVNGGTSTDDGGNDLYLVADDEGETATFTCISAGVWLVDVIGTWTPTQP